MDWSVPLFVIVPLGAAFLTAIIGSASQAFGRFFTSIILAFLSGLTLYLLFTGKSLMVA